MTSFERKLQILNIQILNAKCDYMISPNMYTLWYIRNLNKNKENIRKKINSKMLKVKAENNIDHSGLMF